MEKINNYVDYNNWTTDEIENLIFELQSIKEGKYKNEGFPYLEIYKKSTNSGEEIEKMLSAEIFKNLFRVTNKSHDHTINTDKPAETKSIRMMVKGKGGYEKRAISILDENKGFLNRKKKYGGNISTMTFQQVKPKEFDFMIGVVLFKDGMDLFVLPSELISKKVKVKEKNMVYLSGQHEGNLGEGQINYNDKVLNNHYLFSLYNDGKNLYYFDRLQKVIGDKYNKLCIVQIINEKFGL
jgi:hypothetical protein